MCGSVPSPWAPEQAYAMHMPMRACDATLLSPHPQGAGNLPICSQGFLVGFLAVKIGFCCRYRWDGGGGGSSAGFPWDVYRGGR